MRSHFKIYFLFTHKNHIIHSTQINDLISAHNISRSAYQPILIDLFNHIFSGIKVQPNSFFIFQ